MIDGTPATRIGDALGASPLVVALHTSSWLYPTVETLHLLAIALLFGSIVVADLRLLGWRRDVGLKSLLRVVLPVTLASLLLVVPTGLLLFAAHATDLVGNRVFIVKMTLLFAAAINALMFHAGPYRAAVDAPAGSTPSWSTRVFAAISIAIWVAVVVAGRTLAAAS